MRIRKLVVLAMVLVSLGISSFAGSTPPASATPDAPATVDHQPAGYYIASPTAGFVCGATRPDASYEIQYAKPFYFDAYHVRYTCIGHRHSPNVVCSWVGIQWTGGPATGHDYSCHPW